VAIFGTDKKLVAAFHRAYEQIEDNKQQQQISIFANEE
jgi:hypothetical protein